METKTAKHTPTPWHRPISNEVKTDSGRLIAHCYPENGPLPQIEEMFANAQHIVRAVNCHDELLDMLKAIEARISIEQQEHMDDPAPATYCCGAIHIELLALIAKAESS